MVFPKEIRELPFEEFISNSHSDNLRLRIYRKNINHEKMFVLDFCYNKNFVSKQRYPFRILVSKKKKEFSVYKFGAARCQMVNPENLFYRYTYCIMEESDKAELKHLVNERSPNVYLSDLYNLLTEYYKKNYQEMQKQAGYISDDEVYTCPTEFPDGLIDFIQHDILANDRTLIYKRGNVRGRCSMCGEQVTAPYSERFIQFNKTYCPNCGEQVTCILENSNTWAADYVKNVIAIQKGKDSDIWFRQWHVIRNNSGIYNNPNIYLKEIGRYLIRGNKAAMWTSVLKENQCLSRPIEYDVHGWSRHRQFAIYDGPYKFFGSSIEQAVSGTKLQYAMLEDYLHNENIKNPDIVKYAICFARYPVFEFLYKSGYYNVIQAKISGYGNGKAKDAISWQKNKLKECFKIPLGYLKFKEPEELTLHNIYSMNQMYAEHFSEQEIKIACASDISLHTLSFLKKYVSVAKLYNYAEKQQAISDETFSGIIGIYRDYINDCVELKLDLKSKSVLFPRDVVKAHNDMIIEKKAKENAKYIDGMKKAAKKMKKFSFSKDGLIIRPAKSPEELILEGNTLHHCVGGYAGRVASGDTAIFFVREADNADKPFYTLEYCDKHIVQCRTYNNRSYDTDKRVEAFVKEWYQNKVKGA